MKPSNSHQWKACCPSQPKKWFFGWISGDIYAVLAFLLDKDKNVFISFLSGPIPKVCFSREKLSELYLHINYCFNTHILWQHWGVCTSTTDRGSEVVLASGTERENIFHKCLSRVRTELRKQAFKLSLPLFRGIICTRTWNCRNWLWCGFKSILTEQETHSFGQCYFFWCFFCKCIWFRMIVFTWLYRVSVVRGLRPAL